MIDGMGRARWTGAAACLLLGVWLAGGCVHHTSRIDVSSTGREGGEVVLDCQPADATLEVDGVQQGLCSDFAVPGRGLGLKKGMHKLIIQKKGFVPYITYAEPGGATLSLRVVLQPLEVDGAK